MRARVGMLYIDLPGYRTGLFLALGWELVGGRWGSLFLLELGFVGGLEGSSHSRGPMLGAQLCGAFVHREGREGGGLGVLPPCLPFILRVRFALLVSAQKGMGAAFLGSS